MSSALMELIEEITSSLTLEVFILSEKKACDTIDHKLSIRKLEHYGVRVYQITW